MSITAFNMRLTGLSSVRWIYAHWTFFALLAVYTLVAIFLNVFKCNPIVSNYDPYIAGHGHGFTCLPILVPTITLRVMHVTMDYCLLFVSIFLCWKMNTTLEKKIRLFCLFSVGGLSCIGSVMSLVVTKTPLVDIPCMRRSLHPKVLLVLC